MERQPLSFSAAPPLAGVVADRTVPDHPEAAPTRGTDAIVIGAGPYGLAITAHLSALSVDTDCFGQPMVSWSRHMPAGMLLKSVPSASNISAPAAGSTLADYCNLAGEVMPTERDPIPVELFVRYGLWFKGQWAPQADPDMVQQVSATGDGFTVRLASGEERQAKAVVVASGALPYAYVPPLLLHARRGGAGWLTHSSEHDDLSIFAGQRLAVIGAGQSALETAVLAAEAGAKVDVISRAPTLRWGSAPASSGWRHYGMFKPSSPLGPGWSLASVSRGAPAVHHLPVAARLELVRKVLGPSGAWWMHSRFDAAGLSVHTGAQVQALKPIRSGVELKLESAGQSGDTLAELPVDHVIAATGFRVDMEQCEFLDAPLRAALTQDTGFPRLSSRFESTVPGLYFAGLPAAGAFGPLMRFVAGTEFCAPRIATAIAQRVRRQARR